VKFKKLTGGGYFKIINQSVPTALKNLGYTETEADKIIKYATGTASFAGAPFINHQTLSEKGFIADEIKRLDAAALTAFEIGFVFNKYTLGEGMYAASWIYAGAIQQFRMENDRCFRIY
jgi:ribonucleoside-diphosphate reductase alpha chain